MEKLGMRRNSQKMQRINAALETIIEEFGSAMRTAFKPYIRDYKTNCRHEVEFAFTPHMQEVWRKYVDWCTKNG